MQDVRAYAFNVAFVAYTIVLGLVGIAVRLLARHRALDLARLWVRGTVRLLDVVGGIRVEIAGHTRLPSGGALVASQHRSAIDSLIWLLIVARPSYVMKRELARIPLVGPLLAPAGMIAVDRRGGASALRGLLKAGHAAVAAGRTVVIFPEGTRVARTGDAPLQPGVVALARALDRPLLPAVTDSGDVWGGGFLLRTGGSTRPRVIRIVVGEPVPADKLRAELLHAVDTGWRLAEATLRDPGTAWARL